MQWATIQYQTPPVDADHSAQNLIDNQESRRSCNNWNENKVTDLRTNLREHSEGTKDHGTQVSTANTDTESPPNQV